MVSNSNAGNASVNVNNSLVGVCLDPVNVNVNQSSVIVNMNPPQNVNQSAVNVNMNPPVNVNQSSVVVNLEPPKPINVNQSSVVVNLEPPKPINVNNSTVNVVLWSQHSYLPCDAYRFHNYYHNIHHYLSFQVIASHSTRSVHSWAWWWHQLTFNLKFFLCQQMLYSNCLH